MICGLLNKSLCKRRQVAAVVMDYCGNTISTGHNGNVDCGECVRDYFGLARNEEPWICNNLHAEEMAMIGMAKDESPKIIFVTAEPCSECMKLILRFDSIKLLWYYNNNELVEVDLEGLRNGRY